MHPAFPTVPAPGLEPSPALFTRLEPDTLFFAFFYQQGTYSQYLAARELKRQGWRYSNRAATFFKRVGEPDEVTPEGERGTYSAFDGETGWTTRLKQNVTLSRAEWAEPGEH